MKGKQVTKEQFELVCKLENIYFEENLIISENNGKWIDKISNADNPYKYIEPIPFFNKGLFMIAEQELIIDKWEGNTLINKTKTKWFWEEDRFDDHKKSYEWAKKNGLNV